MQIIEQGNQNQVHDPCENADFGLIIATSADETQTADAGVLTTAAGTGGDASTTATYVYPQFKSVTVDGQEAIFIPITAASGNLKIYRI